MKITKAEVKTIYDIRFNFTEFKSLYTEFVNADENSVEKIIHSLAFNGCDFSNLSDAYINGLFQCLSHKTSNDRGQTYDYIAKYFGFDGWDNAGYYDKASENYCMVVYKHGDSLN